LSTQNTTADYGELTNDVYALLVDAFASTDKRALNYWKSVWDITSRPDTPVTIDSVIRRNLERANQLTNLTIGEMRSAGRESAAFTKKLLAEGTKVQDTALGSFRRLLEKYAANVNYVKETTSATLDDLSRHLEDLEKRTVPLGGSK
jgi:sucrose-6-phosphate hydrolase SacC (GH32 family)